MRNIINKVERFVRSSPAIFEFSKKIQVKRALHSIYHHTETISLSLDLLTFDPATEGQLKKKVSIVWDLRQSDRGRYFKLLNPDEYHLLVELSKFGCIPLFFLIDGNPVGYIWYVDSDSKNQQLPDLVLFKMKLKDGEIYLFNYYLKPEFRGGNNSTETFKKLIGSVIEMKYEKAFGLVDKDNISARWLYSATGWKPEKELGISTFFSSFRYKNKTLFVNPKLMCLIKNKNLVPAFDYMPIVFRGFE